MFRIVLVAIGLLLAGVSAAGPSGVRGDWAWEETQQGLRMSVAGHEFIDRELVQLIDRSDGWRVVYQAGSEASQPRVEPLGDGRRGTRATLGGRLSMVREVWAAEDGLHLGLSCTIPDPGPATDFYYSLQIPAAMLEGGAWRARTEGVPTGGQIPKIRDAGTIVDGFDTLELLGAGGLVAVAASARGAQWSFQEWRQAPHDAYRLRVEVPTRADMAWSAELVFHARPGGVSVDDLLAVVRREAQERLSLAHTEALALRSVRCVTQTPRVGSSCEVLIDLGCSYDDPFDPQDVAVEATIECPSRTYVLPGFYCQDFSRQKVDEADTVQAGDAQWRVRFLPVEPGPHSVTIRVTDGTGTVSAVPLRVPIAKADWRGLVRVSETNPLALARGEGKAFYPLGVNIFEQTRLGRPLPTDRIDRVAGYIDRLARAGGNFIRLRMDSWWLAIDNPPDVRSGYLGPGRLNQRACWDIDTLLDLCEAGGVQVMLCLENANANVNSPKEAWRQRYNAYSSQNGGPCEAPADFWTDATARELFRRKIRYCVARWSAHPALAMWEFFNEVIIGDRAPADPIIAWHDEMSREFKRLDPHSRIVTTSPMGERDPEANRRLWQVEGLDVAQVHDYSHVNTADVHATAAHGAAQFSKPFIVGEFGMHGGKVRSGLFKHKDDVQGLVAHLGHWSTAMSLAAGPAMDWYVSNYVDALDLWHDFSALKAFVVDLPRTDPSLAMAQVRSVRVALGRLLDQPGVVTITPDERWQQAPDDTFTVQADGRVTPPESLNGILWGTQNHADLRRPPTFQVDYPAKGSFTVHVTEVVGRGPNPVRISVDDEVALERDLVCEEGAGEKWEVRQPGPEGNLAIWYNTDLSVPLPAGKHVVRVENLGRDRLTVSYRLAGYATVERAAEVFVAGLTHAQGAHLWLHNRTWNPGMILTKTPAVPARRLQVTVGSLRDGPAHVQWFSPSSGQKLRSEPGRVRGRCIQLEVDALDRDIACKILYR